MVQRRSNDSGFNFILSKVLLLLKENTLLVKETVYMKKEKAAMNQTVTYNRNLDQLKEVYYFSKERLLDSKQIKRFFQWEYLELPIGFWFWLFVVYFCANTSSSVGVLLGYGIIPSWEVKMAKCPKCGKDTIEPYKSFVNRVFFVEAYTCKKCETNFKVSGYFFI